MGAERTNNEVSMSAREESNQIVRELFHMFKNENVDVILEEYMHVFHPPYSIDSNQQNESGETFLHCAVNRQDLRLVRALLERGANPNIPNVYGGTPLHWAVIANNKEIVRVLLDAGARPELQSAHYPTPLAYALLKKFNSIASLLIERARDINDFRAGGGATYLHVAVTTHNLFLLERLLEHNADPRIQDERGRTSLHLAVIEGALEMARYLLEKNSEIINIQDRVGRTPLHYAVIAHNVPLLSLLLEKHAQTDIADANDRTVDVLALDMGLGNDEDGNTTDDENESAATTYRQGEQMNNLAVLHSLLTHRNGIQANSIRGTELLCRAIEKNNVAAVRLLLKQGASPFQPNAAGALPSTLAAGVEEGGSILHYLVEAARRQGASEQEIQDGIINGRDIGGNTPLRYAFDSRNEGVVSFLQLRNVDLSIQDEFGMSLFDVIVFLLTDHSLPLSFRKLLSTFV